MSDHQQPPRCKTETAPGVGKDLWEKMMDMPDRFGQVKLKMAPKCAGHWPMFFADSLEPIPINSAPSLWPFVLLDRDTRPWSLGCICVPIFETFDHTKTEWDGGCFRLFLHLLSLLLIHDGCSVFKILDVSVQDGIQWMFCVANAEDRFCSSAWRSGISWLRPSGLAGPARHDPRSLCHVMEMSTSAKDKKEGAASSEPDLRREWLEPGCSFEGEGYQNLLKWTNAKYPLRSEEH